MPKPTPQQVEYLQSVKIEVPPTKTAASSLIEMIEEGNRLFMGMNKWQKIAQIKSMQEKWIGKRVVATTTPRLLYGTVLYLRPYQKREFLMGQRMNDPWEARVQWDDRNASSVVLHTIKIFTREEQAVS